MQHSLLDDLTSPAEDRYVAPEADDFVVDSQAYSSSPEDPLPLPVLDSSPANSPPRKQPRIYRPPELSSPPPEVEAPDALWQSFLEETDNGSENSTVWAETLHQTPAIWPHFLRHCTQLLNDALTSSAVCPVFSGS